MTPTLLHAVARRAEAITPDADLLARYARERDSAAFEELVRRHGPLVWAVCRHLLPHHADAEDAFQAVFLALVRSASGIRDGRAVPAWLHGVAVRVATRVRRGAVRRKAREAKVAAPEADRPVSDEAWEALSAMVHEEVERLPAAERNVFVLCELQGVPQPDAAARLGAPLGTVSGRLCKARQRLLDRLTARGVAPAAVVGIGLTAGAAGAVPAKLVGVVSSFPGSPAAATSAATALARGLTEGVAMRMKLVAATAVVVTAMGLTGGAVWLSKADAQPPGTGAGGFGAPPGMGGSSGPPPGGFAPGGPGPGGAPGGAPPAGAGGGPPAGGAWGWAGASPATWEYKFVDAKNDRKAFEAAITQHGKEGWEFCSSERFAQGELVLVFKKKRGGDFGGVPGISGWRGDWRDVIERATAGKGEPDSITAKLKHTSASDVVAAIQKVVGKDVAVSADPKTNSVVVAGNHTAIKEVLRIIEELDAKPKAAPPIYGSGPPMVPGGMGAPPKPAGNLTIVALRNATASEMATVLKKVFPAAEVTPEPRSNQLLIRADAATLEELKALITKLDVALPPVPTPK